ncbi:hypothetical protein INT45_014247 [Circinella minor]|uniref:Uncharacterized protein n=1 Tax=Circinella minor TaxID=1195481 RepID=A0A8H7SDI2_9FUNG|nr:hypothetical protein INT45_014247 [Circinella minor]
MLIPVLFTSCTKSLPAVYSPLPPTPSKPLQYNIIRPTRLSRRQEKNEQNNNQIITPRPNSETIIEEPQKEKEHQEPEGKKTIAAQQTSTNDNDETVIINVTTVVVVAAGGSTPNPDNQVLNTPVTTTVAPEGQNGDTFEDQLQDDQEALHRTTLILGLVGGLIGIALVASIVIFTKMRIRKRKLSKERDDHLVGSNSSNSSVYDGHYTITDDEDNDYNSTRNDNNNDMGNNNSSIRHQQPSLTRQRTDNEYQNNDPPSLQPSAPPAEDPVIETNQQRRVIPMGSQMTPAPSAPTAKELDAANNTSNVNDDYGDMPSLYPMRPPNVGGSSSTTAHNHNHQEQQQSTSSSSTTCPHCFEHTPSAPPVLEAPPPAYTPTAPPLYVLPPNIDHTCHHQTPSSTSNSSLSSTTNTINDLLLPSSRNINSS